MNYAVLLAGGIGNRMKTGGFPKQYIEVEGKPVIVYTLEQLERCPLIDSIIIVASDEWVEQILNWSRQYHITKLCGFAVPGADRQLSILNGVDACMAKEFDDNSVVVIHDAVRPLVPVELLTSCIETAARYGGCMPVLPMKDTVYESRNGKCISGLLERNTLFVGQAPEAFRLSEYARLNHSVAPEQLGRYQGSSQIAFQYGVEVRMIPGAEINFKLTTPEDMDRFREICAKSSAG